MDEVNELSQPSDIPANENGDLPANDPAQAQETEVKPVEQEKPKNEQPDWLKKRFAELTAKRHDADRRAAEATERAAQLERQLAERQQESESGNVDYSQLIEKAAEQRAGKLAEQMAARQTFNSQCNDIASKGKSDFPDFDNAIKNFNDYFGGLSEDFLRAAVNVPDAHKVLHHLGQPENLGEFARINELDPYARAVELVKLSQSVGKAKPVSKAPAPIDPIDGSGSVNTDPDKMTDSEWKKWREANRKSKR